VITGVHTVIFSREPEAVREFFRDVLEFPAVDAGGGWRIFALPPSEVAVHPDQRGGRLELYLMCDDLQATIVELEAKGVELSRPVEDLRWGIVTAIRLPDGEELGLYEPRHPVPSYGTD
jgi:catechol 2,3-dioxygenase-like lactoylglutathione lyase family enzyme